MPRYSLLALATTAASTASALELTSANFDEMTAGKTVFLKMYAPWCGHCKAMGPDWAKLEKDFEGHAVALVASVDCTSSGGDSICADFNVEGFPTLVWGDTSSTESYEGGRDYESLKAFADEFVTKPVCSIFNLAACDDKQKEALTAIDKKSDQELLEIAEKVGKLAKAEEKKFDDFVENLQKEYERVSDEFNANTAKIQEDNQYGYVKQIMKKRGIKDPLADMDDDDMMMDDDDLTGGEL